MESLTHNYFILGSSSGVEPLGNLTSDPKVLKMAFKTQQVIIQTFWKRFAREYFPEILKYTKWYDPVEPIRENNKVAIVNDYIANSWQLDRIVDVARSKDGNVSHADVQATTIKVSCTRPWWNWKKGYSVGSLLRNELHNNMRDTNQIQIQWILIIITQYARSYQLL